MKNKQIESVDDWIKRTGKKPQSIPKGKPQPLGKRFKWKDVGKGQNPND